MNTPGLPALAYRVGTHATLLETMKARLSSADFPELADLKTRGGDDPAIALLDAWALVADVLTFYQERIANEGYLRTATERRSILELARLIGYELRPGVAATAYLAYTLDEDRSKTTAVQVSSPIPAGSLAQSVPDPGELPQSFETSDALDASPKWNNLQVRLTRPQKITCDDDTETGVTNLETLYFEGLATNLKPNDPLLIVCGFGEGQQQLCWVEDVKTQAAENRTEVTLQRSREGASTDALVALQSFLEASIQEAKSFHGKTATEVVAVLENLRDYVSKSDRAPKTVVEILLNSRPSLDEVFQLAVKRKSTRLATWIGEIQEELDNLAAALSSAAEESTPPVSQTATPLSALQALGAILKPLAAPPSEHPANEAGLTRSNKETFAQQADTAPQLMTALRPELAPVLYKAWESLAQPLLQPGVYAFRVKTAPFGNNAAPKPVFDDNGKIDGSEEWPIAGTEVTSVKLTFEGAETILAVVSIRRGTDTYGISLLKTTAAEVKNGTISELGLKVTVSGTLTGTSQLDITLDDTLQKNIFSVKTADSGPSLNISLHTNDTLVASQIVSFGQSLRFPVQERKLAISFLQDQFGLTNATVAFRATPTLTIQLESLLPPDQRNVIALDAPYDQIVPDSWVVIQRPDPNDPKKPPLVMFDRAKSVETVSKNDYNLTPKVTQIALLKDWLFEPDRLLSVMRHTTVFAQSEKLTLAEEPIDDDIQGDHIELDELYAGLQPGRWIIVCGERTDIGDVTGVRACELQMLASVEQGDAPHSTLVLADKLAYSYAAETVKIYGNVVKATHGETRKETLGSGDGGKATQQFTLRQPPLTFVAAPNPSGVDSTLKVYVNDVEWHETDSLSGLEPADRNFITRTDDEGKTRVIFGNGQQGARLPTGQENIRAAYRNGIGKGGNVKPGQISQLGTRPHGVSGVTNPLRASGGADKEGRDQARENAPLAVMALDRLVSTQDYADFARTFAGIGKASAVRLSDGRRQLVHLTIAGADDIPIDKSSDLYRNLVKALRDFGDPYLPIQVDVRELLALVISASVRVLPDYLWESVKPRIVATLLDEFGFQRRELGQTVFLSEVISAIQRVTGVASVDVDLLHSISESELLSSKPEDLISKLKTLAEASKPDPFVRVRLAETVAQAKDSRPGASDINGIFPAQLAFLTPEVAATIILNEAPV